MRIPMKPPRLEDILARLSVDRRSDLLTHPYFGRVLSEPYRPWSAMRFRKPPDDLDHDEWWLVTKLARSGVRRELPLVDENGRPFGYALPDEVLQAADEVDRYLSGSIGIPDEVTNPATKNRYLVNSLIEESITSSQLEGAATTRRVAKEMLRAGRRPVTRDERMIANNYAAMQFIGEVRAEPLTVERILDLHHIVTEDTLDAPGGEGRFQRPDEERVTVYFDDEPVHRPPAAELLPERIERLCAFANGLVDDTYVPPVLRAIIVHFMVGYDHPFVDGNGRTARALFYWTMLQQGYWMSEFISVSHILKNAPAKYARSYLESELDDGDLTYFICYQLDVLRRAIRELRGYLDRKAREMADFQHRLATAPGEFNHRQAALLQHALRHPGTAYTVESHRAAHHVVSQTARQDLDGLRERGLLQRAKVGRRYQWTPVRDLSARLKTAANC